MDGSAVGFGRSDVSNGAADVSTTGDLDAVFEAVLASADEALVIAVVDDADVATARVVFVNEAFTLVTGHGSAAAVGSTPLSLLDPFAGAADHWSHDVSRSATTERLLRRSDGRPYWAEVTFSELDLPGAPRHVIGRIRDVDERHHANERLAHAATHDALTGLPNRVLLIERLDEALRRDAGRDGAVAVMFVDLDHFKLVNDSLGHECGDAVLREVSARLVRCTGPGDTVGRFGGDELVIVHGTASDTSAVELAERVLDSLAAPMVVGGRELVMSASIGVATHTGGTEESEQLLRNADTALYAAKERGRGRVEQFSEELFRRVVRRVEVESELRVALREDQLFLEYQPQVDLSTGRVVGVEALVRWAHPERGLVMPGDFIAVAEECGLIVQLGRWVLREACRQFVAWHATSRQAPPAITVNVSIRQLDDPTFVDDLIDILDETGIDPASLCLELTESALMRSDADDGVAVLDRLRSLGVFIGIDDFGTEYSSLARLRDLPVEILKIDRSFVDGLGTESGDTAIVASIMSLSLAMGLHVVAEGVETERQAVALAELGCSVAQGFLFSRPVHPDEIAALGSRRLWRPPSPTARNAPATLTDEQHPAARRGRRRFVDEFLDHIGAPMSDAAPTDGSDA
ncbi:MAG: EAL domain-containing protein [Acidimicrobiales bacterium]